MSSISFDNSWGVRRRKCIKNLYTCAPKEEDFQTILANHIAQTQKENEKPAVVRKSCSGIRKAGREIEEDSNEPDSTTCGLPAPKDKVSIHEETSESESSSSDNQHEENTDAVNAAIKLIDRIDMDTDDLFSIFISVLKQNIFLPVAVMIGVFTFLLLLDVVERGYGFTETYQENILEFISYVSETAEGILKPTPHRPKIDHKSV